MKLSERAQVAIYGFRWQLAKLPFVVLPKLSHVPESPVVCSIDYCSLRLRLSDIHSGTVETYGLEVLFGRDPKTFEESVIEGPVAHPRSAADVPDGRGEVRIGFDVLQSQP